MIEKIIRSPLSMIFFLLIFGGIVYLNMYSPDYIEAYKGWITFGAVIIIALYFLLIMYHNRQKPDKKVHFWGWIPYEFKEEDEGRQWVTFQACRKAYIFYSFAVPFAIVLIMLIDSFPALPLILLLLMALCQYIIFWQEERKYYQQESEDD